MYNIAILLVILNHEFFVLQELANLSTLELIQNDGSPSTRKLFVLWNPILRPKSVSSNAYVALIK